jgi:hypothetical protein
LLQLPAAADNAAKQTEPPKGDPPKRKRRWFQFSLRTMMVVVTLLALACWGAVDRARLIRERDEARQREAAALKAMELLNYGSEIDRVQHAIDRVRHASMKEIMSP